MSHAGRAIGYPGSVGAVVAVGCRINRSQNCASDAPWEPYVATAALLTGQDGATIRAASMKRRAGAPVSPALDALTEAYCNAYGQLIASVNTKVRCKDTAQDIVHDAFLKIANVPAPAKVVEPRAYIFRLVRNLAFDALRRQSFQKIWFIPLGPAAEQIGEAPRAEEILLAKERAKRLKAAIAALGPQRRKVYHLRQVEGLTHAEIAARLGISVHTAEKHMARALSDLRAAMRDDF
jgi:RNA polymerase sigma-19 factor, ECF subfamily